MEGIKDKEKGFYCFCSICVISRRRKGKVSAYIAKGNPVRKSSKLFYLFDLSESQILSYVKWEWNFYLIQLHMGVDQMMSTM